MHQSSHAGDLCESRARAEHLLKRALALQLLDLALQDIDAVILEGFLDTLLRGRVPCDRPGR